LVGLLSQSEGLLKLGDHRLSDDLFVFVVVNSHEVKTHGRAEGDRSAIVQIGPGDLSCHLHQFIRKLDPYRVRCSLDEPFGAIQKKAFTGDIPRFPFRESGFRFHSQQPPYTQSQKISSVYRVNHGQSFQ